jgi:hypothetical protein
VIPLSKGGSNRQINIVDCCSRCNGKKSNILPGELLVTLDELISKNLPWGRDKGERLLTIRNNVQKVIVERVEKYGKRLYKPAKKEKEKKPDVEKPAQEFPTIHEINILARKHQKTISKKNKTFGADAGLSVNSNLTREPAVDKSGKPIIILSEETQENFHYL